MFGDHLCWNQVGENELSVFAFAGRAHSIRLLEFFLSMCIVLFQEIDHAAVVFVSYLVCFREVLERWHVVRGGGERAQHNLAERYAVQTEVRFEEKVRDIVQSPLARVFERCTIRKTDLP